MAKLVQTPELLGAFTSGFNSEAMEKFVANPCELAAAVGVRDDVVVQTVKNSADTINIVLPFYSQLEKRAGKELSDDDLAVASGGAGGPTAEEMEIYRMGHDAILYGQATGDKRTEALGRAAKGLVIKAYIDEEAVGQAAIDEWNNRK